MQVTIVSRAHETTTWFISFTLTEGERVRPGDKVADPTGQLWSVLRAGDVPHEGWSALVMRHKEYSWDEKGEIVHPPVPDPEPEPIVGAYVNRTVIDDATAIVAAGWWADRLRDKEDLGTILHEHDVLERFPEPQKQRIGGLRTLLRREPIPEEKIAPFEQDLIAWLRNSFFQPEDNSCLFLKTDYEPCWPPLYDLAKKYELPRMRFPWKTTMRVFRHAVVVDDQCIHGVLPEGWRRIFAVAM